MKSSVIGIGIVGAGRAGMIHARNFARLVPGALLAGVSDPIAAARAAVKAELGEVADFEDYRDLLDDRSMQGIVITAPTVRHREIAVAAAERSKHVFCEKPMAMNTAECDAMIAAAEKAGV